MSVIQKIDVRNALTVITIFVLTIGVALHLYTGNPWQIAAISILAFGVLFYSYGVYVVVNWNDYENGQYENLKVGNKDE